MQKIQTSIRFIQRIGNETEKIEQNCNLIQRFQLWKFDYKYFLYFALLNIVHKKLK